MASSPLSPPTSFEFRLITRDEPLTLVSFRGREEVSKPFRFRVRVAIREEGEDLHGRLLGEPAALVFHGEHGPLRSVTGIVAAAEDHRFSERDGRALDLTLVPSLWRLSRRRTRRIFQHESALDIAAVLLAEHGVAHRFAVREPPRPRGYAVQYDETDLAFLARLLAEEGLFTFFEHPEAPGPSARERLVVAGDPHDYVPLSGDPRLRYRAATGEHALHADDSHVRRLVTQSRVRTRAALNRGYDFKNPRADLRAAAGAADPLDPSVIYEHEGEYEDDLGHRPAAVRLAQERRRAATASGESFCRRLAPGHRFTLEGHESATLDGAWAVERVLHAGFATEAAEPGKPLYENTFRCVRADLPLRPRHRPQKPRVVTETATVVGPPGKDIHTDPLGRVKVQFHWDLAGVGDDKSTCWLRVAQAWAGAGWGAQFIPRVGMEVLVTYLGGDPDRPLVTGCVYNATHLPPFPPGENPARSGLRTQSSPPGLGQNELSFQDAAGMEQVYLHAQRDYDEIIRARRSSRVGAGSSVEIAGDSEERVGGDVRREAGGGRETRIGKDDTLHVAGDRGEEVTGDLSSRVGGSASLTVLGSQRTLVHGGRVVVVGTQEDPTGSEQIVYGPATVSSDTVVTLRASQSVRLVCGESILELLPDKIVLRAPTIESSAKDTLTLGVKDGPTMTVGEEVEILSKKLHVFTDGAALEMDKEVKIDGDAIKLGYNPSKPSHDAKDEDPETKPLELTLTDWTLDPYAEKTYHLSVEGLRFEGKTDKGGKLKHDIPKSATQATLRLWTAVFPEGPQRLYQIKLGEMPAPDDLRGAQQRLKNLGYYGGPVDGQEGEELSAAIREMQIDHAESHGLEATGELDEGTAGALEEIHGS